MSKLENEKTIEAEKHNIKTINKTKEKEKEKNQVHKISNHTGDIIIKRELIQTNLKRLLWTTQFENLDKLTFFRYTHVRQQMNGERKFYIYVCIYICVCVCIYMCIYMCVYICVYIYIYCFMYGDDHIFNSINGFPNTESPLNFIINPIWPWCTTFGCAVRLYRLTFKTSCTDMHKWHWHIVFFFHHQVLVDIMLDEINLKVFLLFLWSEIV